MEETKNPVDEKSYIVAPVSDSRHVPDSGLVDVTVLKAENQTNEQAAAVMTRNSAGAEALVADSLWEYALLRENDRNDDPVEVLGAANEAANARHFLDLFQESFQEFRRGAEYGKLLLGEQVKWRPTLKDANGQQIGSINHVLLNPTLPQVGNKPVVQIILPNRDYRQEVASRLKPDQQKAVENGQSVAFLERRTTLHDDIMVQSLMKMMTPLVADQQQRVIQAMQEYRQVQADTKPEDIAGLRQSFGRIIEQTLNVEGFRPHRRTGDTLLDKMLEVNQLQRVTYHPDINILGKQSIHMQTVPLSYKGVDLQPVQVKNLLFGNSIEIVGLRDERRSGLYRASVRFNVLHNKPEEASKHEEVKTERNSEFRQHQQRVHHRGSDEYSGQSKKTESDKSEVKQTEHQTETHSRTKFRMS